MARRELCKMPRIPVCGGDGEVLGVPSGEILSDDLFARLRRDGRDLNAAAERGMASSASGEAVAHASSQLGRKRSRAVRQRCGREQRGTWETCRKGEGAAHRIPKKKRR